MADCLYEFKGKTYTYDELVKELTSGELARIAKVNGIDLTQFKNPNGQSAFELSGKSFTERLNDALKGKTSGLFTIDDSGEIKEVDSHYKGEEKQWDTPAVKKFTDGLNHVFRVNQNEKGNINMIVLDGKAYDEIYKDYFDGASAPRNEKGEHIGKAFADTKNSNIIVNSEAATLSTPLHEASHLFLPFIEKNAPELYKAGLKIIKADEMFKAAEKDFKAYKELYDKNKKELLDKGYNEVDADKEAKNIASSAIGKEQSWATPYFKKFVSEELTKERQKEISNRIADELLAKKVEEFGKAKIASDKLKAKSLFQKWIKKMYDYIKNNGGRGFKDMSIEKISDLSLDAFSKAAYEEIMGTERPGKDGAKELIYNEIEKAERGGKGKPRLKGVKKEETKTTINSDDVLNFIQDNNPNLFEQVTQVLMENKLITDPSQASFVIAEFLGDRAIPKALEGALGKKGARPSGLIKKLYNEVVSLAGQRGEVITYKDVNKLIKKGEAKTKEELTSVVSDELSQEELDLFKQLDGLEEIKKEYDPEKEEDKAMIDVYNNEISKILDKLKKISEKKSKVYKSEGTQEKIERAEDQDNPLGMPESIDNNSTNAGNDLTAELANVETDSVSWADRKMRFFNFFRSKDKIVPIPVISEVEKMQGRASDYAEANNATMAETIGEMNDFLADYNSKRPEGAPEMDAYTLSEMMTKALKGDKEVFNLLSPKLQDRVYFMRANIDNYTKFLMSSGFLSPASINLYQENLGTYLANIYEKYTSIKGNKLITAGQRAVASIYKKLGKEVPKAFDVRAHWVKNLTPQQIRNAQDGIRSWIDQGLFDTQEQNRSGDSFRKRQSKINRLNSEKLKVDEKIGKIQNGGYKRLKEETKKKNLEKFKSESNSLNNEINKLTEEYNKLADAKIKQVYTEIVQQAEAGKFIETANGRVDLKKFERRKDIPQWYKELIGESTNIFKNYFLTIGKMQSAANTLMAQEQILSLGLTSGFIVKDNLTNSVDPKYANYIKVGGKAALTGSTFKNTGPLNGYLMHPQVHKYMFEVPAFTIGDNNIIANGFMKSIQKMNDFTNAFKVTYNPSSLERNFISHFSGDLMLNGTYYNLMRLGYEGKGNFLADATDHYISNGVGTGKIFDTYIKGLLKDGRENGLTGSLVENEFNRLLIEMNRDKEFDKAIGGIDSNDGIKQIVKFMNKAVKFAPKGMRQVFVAGDLIPKLFHFETQRNCIAYDVYGKNYYNLNPEQMKAVNEAASLDTKEDFATPTRVADFANTRFFGVFQRYRYEMFRTFFNTLKHMVGNQLTDSYEHIKFFKDEETNKKAISKLGGKKQTRKWIGFTMNSGAFQGSIAIANTLWGQGKSDDQDKMNGIDFNNARFGESTMVYELFQKIRASQEDGSMSQVDAVKLFLPDYQRSSRIEYHYDPNRKKATIWDLGQNDEYGVLASLGRGLMYNVSPTEDRTAINEPIVKRTQGVVGDQLNSFFGLSIALKALAEPFYDKEIGQKLFSGGMGKDLINYYNHVGSKISSSDFVTYTNNLDKAKESPDSYVDVNGKILTDIVANGYKGKTKKIDIESLMKSAVKKQNDQISKIVISKNAEYYSTLNDVANATFGKNYNKLTFVEKDSVNKTETSKEAFNNVREEFNREIRTTMKNYKMYYRAAHSLNFSSNDIDRIFNDYSLNLIELGPKLKGGYITNEHMSNILQKSNKEIDNMDFSRLFTKEN